MLIGIIGGKGLIGKFMKAFFEKNGFDVIVSDVDTPLTNVDLASKCNVVVVSVPISNSIDVINEVKCCVKKDSLLMDVTSLKSNQVSAMLLGTKCSVIGSHPMFGPGVSSVKGQTFVLCKGRGDKWFSWFKSLLAKNGARIKVTDAKKHDEFMAVIQGLMHFNSITTVYAMRRLGFDIEESLEFTSPVYRITMDLLCRILNQNPKLYADIELSNPDIDKVLDEFLSVANEIKEIVKLRDTDKFVEYFSHASDYLGEFKKKAQKESDEIINHLTDE